MPSPAELNRLSNVIIEVALDVHRRLGPGLLESVYEAIVAHELRKKGLHVQTQLPIPVIWDGIHLEIGYRADLMIEHSILVELKSVEAVAPVHKKQLLTHLRLADKRLGLLINFGTELLKDGITRIVNRFEEP